MITEADRVNLPAALRENGGFHMATEWYCRGWKPIPYQYTWHHSDAMNCTWIGGIATAKTTGQAASYLIDCLTIPYFRALSTSVTAKQAELPFNMVMLWIEDNPHVTHLIKDIKLRPWPTITFTNFSEWEFRTAGRDASLIRGFEYDRIGYDECSLDVSGEAVTTLRGRLRGTRPNGTERMARLDTVTSPGAVPWLKERFKRGFNPAYEDYFSMRTATWDNPYLTKRQVKAMMTEMTPELIIVELGGQWPDYGASYFPEKHVDACVAQELYDAAYLALNPEEKGEKPKEGFVLVEDGRIGITKFELPYNPDKRYILAGDPGKGNPPHRNSGVVMVADVTKKPYRLVYMNWVSGNGSINPFIADYKYAIDKYYPELRGLDVTGPQKYLDELAFENYGIQTDGINYGQDKHAMLNALSYDITNQHWRVPPIQGLLRQTKSYTLDLENDKKFAQDLVTTWAQISHLARHITRNIPDIATNPTPIEARKKNRVLARSGLNHPRTRRKVARR